MTNRQATGLAYMFLAIWTVLLALAIDTDTLYHKIFISLISFISLCIGGYFLIIGNNESKTNH